jgi:hypothetical protein
VKTEVLLCQNGRASSLLFAHVLSSLYLIIRHRSRSCIGSSFYMTTITSHFPSCRFCSTWSPLTSTLPRCLSKTGCEVCTRHAEAHCSISTLCDKYAEWISHKKWLRLRSTCPDVQVPNRTTCPDVQVPNRTTCPDVQVPNRTTCPDVQVPSRTTICNYMKMFWARGSILDSNRTG